MNYIHWFENFRLKYFTVGCLGSTICGFCPHPPAHPAHPAIPGLEIDLLVPQFPYLENGVTLDALQG